MSEHVVRSADAEVNVMVFQQLSKPNVTPLPLPLSAQLISLSVSLHFHSYTIHSNIL